MKEYITNAGYELLSRMLSGDCTIEYTKVQMGNGTPTEADLKRMTALSNPVVTLDVESVKIETDNTVDITASFTNAEISEAFYYKEKGIFASDGKKEVLFSYAYTTDPELIPPHSEEYMEKRLKSILKQLQSVDAPINIKVKSGIYVPISDYNRDMEAVEETFEKKVDKEEGKGLSSEDYTTEEKKKLKDTVDLVDKELKVLEEHNKNMTFGSYDKHEYTYDGNYGINSAVQKEKNVKVKDAISSDGKNIESIRTAVNTIGEKLHGEVDDAKRNLNKNGYSEIAGGKNLVNLDYDSLMEKKAIMSGISFSYVSPNCIKLNGTSTKNFSECNMTLLLPTIKDDGGIFSHGKSLTISTTKGFIALYANSGSGWVGLGCYKNFNITIQPEWISLLIRICAKDIGETYNNDLAYIQIEEGSVATEYEPYFPSNKMLAEENTQQSSEMMDIKMLGWSVPRECPIQNEVNGNQFIQKVGRTILNGTEDWVYHSSAIGVNGSFYIYFNGGQKPLQDGKGGYFTRFKTGQINDANMNAFVGSDTIQLRVDDCTAPTYLEGTSKIKQWLSQNNTAVYYEIETYNTMTIDGNEAVEQINSNLDTLQFGEVAGGKNLATVSSFSTQNNEIIFTKKDDSTLIANGSNYTGGVGLTKIFLAKAGITYTAQIITDLQLNMFIWNSDENILVVSPTSSKEISFSVAKDTHISIAIDTNNVVFNNTEIKVQLEEGSVATSYEPYFPSNKMLAEEKADKTETTVNLLNPTLQTTTQNGVTCTNNGDGTYTLNGTANSTARFILKGGFNCSQFVGMKLVGCPSKAIVGGVRKFAIVMEAAASPWNTNADDIGNGSIIVGPSGNSNLFIAVYEGATLDNLVFKPMITTNLSATYDDFVQYTGDSGSLNKDVGNINKDLNNLGLDNLYTDTLQYGSINTDGAVLTISSAKHDESYKPCKEGDTISIITEVSYGQHGVAFYNANKEFISLSVNSVIGNRISVTAPNGAKFFRYYISNLEGGTRDITVSNIGKISVFVNSKIEEDILDGRCRELLWVNDENVKEVGFSTNYTVPNIQDYDLFELIVVDSTDANYTLAQEPRRTVVFSSYLREFFESVRKDGDSVVIARRCIDVFPNRKKDQIEPYNAATITISSSGVSQSEDNTIFIPYTLYGLRKKVK